MRYGQISVYTCYASIIIAKWALHQSSVKVKRKHMI